MGSLSFADRIRGIFRKGAALSGDFFEELGDILVEGDFGAAEAFDTVDKLQDICRREKISDGDAAKEKLAEILEGLLRTAEVPEKNGIDPEIILLLGVNGVGKTTSAAKLARRFRDQDGRLPILAAADTFRAGAIDQLKIHGERLGIRVVAHKPGGDPAAVIYDAVESAQAGNGNLIIADTAGRMHTKNALVEELKKMDRIVDSKAPGSRYLKYLVLDATTGRNAIIQAETFHDAVALDGVILTKYDSSARGGAAFSLAASLKLPVLYICDGEGYGHIRPFDPRVYSREFIGLE